MYGVFSVGLIKNLKVDDKTCANSAIRKMRITYSRSYSVVGNKFKKVAFLISGLVSLRSIK